MIMESTDKPDYVRYVGISTAAHKVAVVGDIFVDPKGTFGPSINILIKLIGRGYILRLTYYLKTTSCRDLRHTIAFGR